MGARILVLGAGFGGLELSAILSEHLAETAEITLNKLRQFGAFLDHRGYRLRIAEERS